MTTTYTITHSFHTNHTHSRTLLREQKAAIDLANQAVVEDKKENFAEAKRLYEQAIEHFLFVIKRK